MKLLTGNCVRYIYLMTQQKRHRDVVLAVLRKLRPVVRHEFVVVQPASVIITDRHDCVKRGSGGLNNQANFTVNQLFFAKDCENLISSKIHVAPRDLPLISYVFFQMMTFFKGKN